MACSLERVVRPAPTERCWPPKKKDVDSGGGMRALSPGKHERRNGLAGKKNVLAERTGTGSPSETLRERLRA